MIHKHIDSIAAARKRCAKQCLISVVRGQKDLDLHTGFGLKFIKELLINILDPVLASHQGDGAGDICRFRRCRCFLCFCRCIRFSRLGLAYSVPGRCFGLCAASCHGKKHYRSKKQCDQFFHFHHMSSLSLFRHIRRFL